jgi:hypothetical protein
MVAGILFGLALIAASCALIYFAAHRENRPAPAWVRTGIAPVAVAIGATGGIGFGLALAATAFIR